MRTHVNVLYRKIEWEETMIIGKTEYSINSFVDHRIKLSSKRNITHDRGVQMHVIK